MKALFLILGLILLASLVGACYATPISQPPQNSGTVDGCFPHHDTNNMMMGCGCGAHSGGKNHP